MREILHQLESLTCAVEKLADDSRTLHATQVRCQSDVATLKVAVQPSSVSPPPIVSNYTTHGQCLLGVPVIGNPLVQGQGLPVSKPRVDPTCAQLPNPALLAGSQLPNPAQEPVVPLSNGAHVSRKTYNAAITGEFVNLTEFAPNTEPSSIMESSLDESTGQIVFKSKNIKRSIDNYLAWSRAWAGYESLLISANSALYQQLADYRLFIQGCEAIYHWASVSTYDQRHRHHSSLTRSLEFNTCNMEIYCCTMNASSVRPNPKACFVCGSLDHQMKDCPFQKTSTKSISTPKKNSSNQMNTGGKSNQNFNSRTDAQAYGGPMLCYNWNNGRCSSPDCWSLHVCSGCRGPEPRITCSRCNAKG